MKEYYKLVSVLCEREHTIDERKRYNHILYKEFKKAFPEKVKYFKNITKGRGPGKSVLR